MICMTGAFGVLVRVQRMEMAIWGVYCEWPRRRRPSPCPVTEAAACYPEGKL